MKNINKDLLLTVCKSKLGDKVEDKVLIQVVDKALKDHRRASFHALVDCIILDVETLLGVPTEAPTAPPVMSFIRDWTNTWK